MAKYPIEISPGQLKLVEAIAKRRGRTIHQILNSMIEMDRKRVITWKEPHPPRGPDLAFAEWRAEKFGFTVTEYMSMLIERERQVLES